MHNPSQRRHVAGGEIDDMALTRAQRKNLAKLADYLEGLPRRYRHFDMSNYTGAVSTDPKVLHYAQNNGGVAQCGTVACAVGHGPAAGILFRPEEITYPAWGSRQPYPNWVDYSNRFVSAVEDFDWAFGGDWDGHDNHHWGAAARIRYLLEHGKPPEGFGLASRKWRAAYRPFDKRHALTPA